MRWLVQIDNWIKERFGIAVNVIALQKHDGNPTLLVDIHPSAEPLQISALPDEMVQVTATTSGVGPGYHACVCKLIQELGRAWNIEWLPADPAQDSGDDTGYFFSGNLAELESYNLNWLRQLCSDTLEISRDRKGEDRALLVKRSSRTSVRNCDIKHFFRAPGLLLTPLGPRSREWVMNVIENPRSGIDYFPWWSAGHAGYRLGYAVYKMWYDVHWRKPIDALEAESLWRLSRYLEEAYKENPSLAYPWAAWHELNEMCKAFEFRVAMADLIAQRACEQSTSPKIGYRRSAIRVGLNGWTVEIPGCFEEKVTENPVALEITSNDGPRRLIRMANPWAFAEKRDGSVLKAAELMNNLSQPEPEVENIMECKVGQMLCRAWWDTAYLDSGEMHWLKCYNIVDGQAVLTSIFVESEDHKEWAIEAWRSICPNYALFGPTGEVTGSQTVGNDQFVPLPINHSVYTMT
jgi:hypothetical protein